MHGIFERLGLDVKADRLAVDVVGQRGVAMAGEAFVRGWFLGFFAGGVKGDRG
jgi:hypothetical protein